MLRKRRWICLVMAIVLMMMTGCTVKKSSSDNETTQLTWYMPMTDREDREQVHAKVAEYVKEKLGVSLEIIVVPFEEYNQKMQIISASGEEYDIAFTSNWLNDYYSNVNKGAFVPLDDLLPVYAPYTYNEMLDKKIWDGVKVNGKIYGSINQQVFVVNPTISIPKKNLKALGMNIQDIKTIDDVHEYLKKVHAETGKYVGGLGNWKEWALIWGIEEFLGTGIVGAIYYNEEGCPQIFNQYESPEYIRYVKKARQLVEEGLVSPVIEDDTKRIEIAFQEKDDPIASKMACIVNYINMAGTAQDYLRDYYVDVEQAPLTDVALISTFTVAATMNAISTTSKHPEEALKVIDLINKDPYLMNLLSYGIEGLNYEKVNDKRINMIEGHEFVTANWAFGNVFNCYVYGEQPEDMQEKDRLTNESGTPSPIFGFVPDLESINLEMSNCKAVTGEYLDTLASGVSDFDSTYSAFMSKLKAAGADKVIAELQRQLDLWWAENNK